MDCSYRDRRGAFSLVELLIVMTVLATILFLALPAFTRAVVITRRVKCASTLRNIHHAYTTRLIDIELHAGISDLHAGTWAGDFAPYVGYHRDAFWCTATGKSDGMGYDGTGDNGACGKPDVKIRIYAYFNTYDVETFNAYPYWLEGNHVDFGRTPGVWKINTDVYAALNRYDMPIYTPGTSAMEYWFVIEDQRIADESGEYEQAVGDQDFNDFDLHVLEEGSHVTLTGYHRDAGYTFALVDTDGNVYDEAGGVIGPIQVKGVNRLSYGMNSQAFDIARFARSSRTVLIVDYKHAVVYTGNSIGLSGGWDVLQAPRHMGKMNALYADGHVETHDPDEIDPAFSFGEPFWDPLTPLE